MTRERNKIEFPAVPTYWLGYNNDKSFYHYGLTDSKHVTENILDVMEEFTQEDDFTSRIAEENISEDEDMAYFLREEVTNIDSEEADAIELEKEEEEERGD